MRVLRVLALESGLLGILGVGLLVASCGPARPPAAVVLSVEDLTVCETVVCARGVTLDLQGWIWDQSTSARYAEIRSAGVASVDSASFPAGWRVVATVPTWWSERAHLVVTGETNLARRTSWVGVRGPASTDPSELPSAAYEAANAREGRESDAHALDDPHGGSK